MSNSRNSLDSLYTIFRAMIRQEIDQTPGFRELTSRSTLPASVDAERTILGAILLDSQSLHEARGKKLEAGDFSLDSHRRIFARMCTLSEAQHAIDLITVSEELDRNKELQAIGGPAYLSSLTEGLPRRLSIEDYVRIVKDKSLLRSVIGICTTAIARAADQGEEALDILSSTESQLLELTEHNLTEGLPRRLNIAEYVAIVHEKAKLRRIVAGCLEAIKACQDQSDTAETIAVQLWQSFKGIRKGSK